MSASWRHTRPPEVYPARHIRPAIDWYVATAWLCALLACAIVWAGILLLAGHLLGWSW